MNRIWIAFAFSCLFSACTKSSNSSHDNTFDPTLKPVISSFNPMTGPVDTTVIISGSNFNPDLTKDVVTFNGTTAVIKSGTTTQLVVIVPQGASSGNISVTVDTNTVTSTNIFTVKGDRWTFVTRFPGTFMDDMASFQLGNKIYIGMGYSNDGPSKELWQYDLSNGKWTRKADFPGAVPGQNIGFAVGNKGYVIVDLENVSQNLPLWEYDTALDTWTSRADFPQPSLDASMIAFTVDNYAYVGGTNDGFPNHSKKMYRYDPGANSWTGIADYPGDGVEFTASFVIGHYAYVGTGTIGLTFYGPADTHKEFYRYDPSTNAWTRKSDFPGTSRCFAAGFSIGSFGYMGTGTNNSLMNDFWQYDPSTDSWKQIEDFGGGYRVGANSFSGDQLGYAGFGHGGANENQADIQIDLWQYHP